MGRSPETGEPLRRLDRVATPPDKTAVGTIVGVTCKCESAGEDNLEEPEEALVPSIVWSFPLSDV